MQVHCDLLPAFFINNPREKSVNILFVCSENKLRSPTAAEVFATYDGVETMSAGTNADADVTVTGDLIEWADAILVMEQSHAQKVSRKFRSLLKTKKLAVLDIRDRYQYMQPELIALLERRVPNYVSIRR